MTMLKPKCTTCHIRNISLLKNCSREALEDISEHKASVDFQNGEYLMKEGEAARGIFCIRSGVIQSEIRDSQRSIIIGLQGKGTVVGHRTTGEKGKTPVTVKAVERVEACYIHAEKFLKLMSKHPSLKTEILRSLSAELQCLERHTLNMVCKSVKQRVAIALIHIAGIYNYRQGGSSIHIHLDRQDIADMVGTSMELVCHQLAELREDGLVNFKAKHFKYFDLEGLRILAE